MGRLAWAAAIIFLGNVPSRVLGFVRELVVIALFGTSGANSAYQTATRLATIVYHLLVSGVISAALVPVFTDYADAPDRRTLARIVDYFPAYSPFGHGVYDVNLFDRFVDAKATEPISSVQSGPFVTGTMVASYWADGGYVGVAIGVAAVAAISSTVYAVARKTSSLRHLLPAAYLLYQTLIGAWPAEPGNARYSASQLLSLRLTLLQSTAPPSARKAASEHSPTLGWKPRSRISTTRTASFS